jgi:hypothetical protein
MEHYAGIDVSLESASLCVVDATGRIVREAKVASEPEVLIGWFRGLRLVVTRIGLEAAPLSQWLYPGMRRARRIRDDAGQDRPQGRARDRSSDAARLVSPSALHSWAAISWACSRATPFAR